MGSFRLLSLCFGVLLASIINTITDVMSNTAVKLINGRYRCLDRLSGSIGSSQKDQKPGKRYPRASAVWSACLLPHPIAFS